MLQLKDLREWIVGEKVTAWDGRILKKLEGLPGGRAWLEGGEESCRPNERIIAYWYSMSMITLSVLFAWGWRGRKLESRNQKLEIGKQKRKGKAAVGDKAKLIERKRLSERQWQPCRLRMDDAPRIWRVH